MKKLFSIVFLAILLAACNNTDNNDTENIAEYAAATVLKVDEAVPSFKLATLDSAIINIDSLKGKTVFLNFFTLSCPMCMLELPQLEKQIWNKYKDRDDFVILSIGREHTNAELEKFYTKKQFTFPMAGDTDRSVYALFAEKFVPRNIIIDKTGKVVYTAIGYNEKDGLTELLEAIKNALSKK